MLSRLAAGAAAASICTVLRREHCQSRGLAPLSSPIIAAINIAATNRHHRFLQKATDSPSKSLGGC